MFKKCVFVLKTSKNKLRNLTQLYAKHTSNMITPKKQFNIYLEPRLITATKYRAIDEQLSLSDLVAKILAGYLQEHTQQESNKEEHKLNNSNNTAPALKLQPMVRVEDMAASIRFYEALGGTLLTQSRDSDWAQITLGGAEIGLLAHPPNPKQHEGLVELNFEAEEPLDILQARLEAAGVKIVRGAADEAFGAQLQVETPDGLLIKINNIAPATFA